MIPLAVMAAGCGMAIVGFTLHSWPRWFNRYFGVDNWRTLAIADHLRRRKPLASYHEERFLIPGASDYPPLFRYLIAAFPKAFIERYEWAVGPACDAIHSWCLCILAWVLTRNPLMALGAQLVYMTSPLVMMENSSMTTRPFAAWLFSLAMFPLVCRLPAAQSPWLVGFGVVVMALLFLTHRLSIQALWVVVLTFTIWDRSPYWVTVYALGTLSAAWVSRGFYWKILRGQFDMFEYWRRNLPFRYGHQVRGVTTRSSKGSKEPDVLARLNQGIMRHGAWAAVLAASPSTAWLVVAAWWLHRFPGGLGGLDAELAVRLIVWGAALLVAGILIRQLPWLRMIGDGERYLDAAALPTALVVSALWTEASRVPEGRWVALGIAGTVGLALLGAVYLQRAVVFKDVKCSIRPGLWKILRYLKTAVPPGATVASVPLHLIPTVEYFTSCRVLSTDNSAAHITHLGNIYPYLRKPVPALLADYGVQYLVLNEAYARLEEVGFARDQIVAQADSFVLVKTAPR